MAIDLNLITIIVFYGLIALFFFKNRKKVETIWGIFFLYRIKKGLTWIRSIANKAPTFWKWFGYAGIPVGFIGMAFILGYLTWKFIRIFAVPAEPPSVQFVLPWTTTTSYGPVLFISVWYFIIAILVVVLVHEVAHGIVSEAWKLKLKSAGVGMLAVIPLAFVEPDEKKLRKQPLKTQLSIFAAGPFANICAALFFVLLAWLLIAPGGLYLASTTPNFPAAQAGLQQGDIIYAVDNQTIKTVPDMVNYMSTIEPGQTIILETSQGLVEVTTVENPQDASRAHLGIQFRQNYVFKPFRAQAGNIPLYLTQLFFWIVALNLGIGLINLMPLGPVDGGRMLGASLERKLRSKKLARKIWAAFTAFSLIVLIGNLILPFILKALV